MSLKGLRGASRHLWEFEEAFQGRFRGLRSASRSSRVFRRLQGVSRDLRGASRCLKGFSENSNSFQRRFRHASGAFEGTRSSQGRFKGFL